jgi:hypothetical protein
MVEFKNDLLTSKIVTEIILKLVYSFKTYTQNYQT